MQALLIYVLLRFVEGQDEEDHMDVPLLSTIQVTPDIRGSSQADSWQLVGQTLVGKLRGRASLLHDISENHSWKEWIFEESRKRYAILLSQFHGPLRRMSSVQNCDGLPHPRHCSKPRNVSLRDAATRFCSWTSASSEAVMGSVFF